MAHAKGCLTVIVGLLVLGLIVNIAELTWPVCLPAGIAVAGWILTIRSRNPFETAAHALLGPVAAGLVFLSALLLVFNVTSPASDTHTIHATERVLVYLDNVAPRWLVLSPAVFVTVLIALMAVTYWLPALKLVSRFVVFKKWAARATAALGAATSFTFFSNVAVLQPKTPDIYFKIDAIYRSSRSQEEKSVGRFLAARAWSQAVSSASATDRGYVRLLIEAVATVPVMNAAGKQTLAGYVALAKYDIGTSSGAMGGWLERPGLPPQRSLVLLDEQLKREAAAGQFADEVTKGMRELMSKAFALETAELRAIGWSFADTLLEAYSVKLEPLGRPYLDKVLDKYFERATEPVVATWSEQIRTGMSTNGLPPSAVTARLETHAALIAMNKAETAGAIQAARTATESVQAAKAAMKASETARADAELLRAERASSHALEAAGFAEAASESVLATAEVAAAIRAEAAGASIAATAAESARALRLVAGATEAAKAAKDAARAATRAAEAVEAARAARAAARAAEAATRLFRVIPK